MKLAIVVGANGFLGSLMVEKLLSNNIRVLAVYNRESQNINKKATILSNNAVLSQDINPDSIFYMSGNYSNSYSQLLEINQTLFLYTQKFPEAKLVYVSSANVYGNNKEIVSENSPFTNPGSYAMSKLSGEFMVASMKKYSIVRLAYVYGPNITNKSFIPFLINSAETNKTIKLFGNGERKQDYLFVDDAIELCYLSAFADVNLVYLGATGNSVSNLEVAQEIQKHIPCEIEFTGTETALSFYFNPEETFKQLNWKPKTPFSQGIKEMLS